jgi:nitroreductase
MRYLSNIFDRMNFKKEYSMDLLKAIKERKSIRAFKSDPVPREKIEEILRSATHAPSAINLQPWEFIVVIGEEKERLSRKLIKAYREKQIPCGPGNVKPLPKTFGKRGAKTLELMNPFLEAMKVNPSTPRPEGQGLFRVDPERRSLTPPSKAGLGAAEWVNPNQFINEGSCNFYGAPVAIIICQDDSFPKDRFIDIGLVLGYLILTAHEFGLGTCPIGLITAYEDEIKEVLNIPENKNVGIGVALGYPDWEIPINRFKSQREDLEKLVRWIE